LLDKLDLSDFRPCKFDELDVNPDAELDASGDLEPVELEPAELEPVELEPVELDPVELESDESEFVKLGVSDEAPPLCESLSKRDCFFEYFRDLDFLRFSLLLSDSDL
jgi:hypothetical protein